MRNPTLNNRPRQNIPTPITILLSNREKPRMMSLLHNNKRNRRPIPRLQSNTSLPNSLHLRPQNFPKLPLANSISVEQNPIRLSSACLIEGFEQLDHHSGKILNDLLPAFLDTDGGGVSRALGVHRTYEGGNGLVRG